MRQYILNMGLLSLAFFADFKLLFILIFVLSSVDLVTGIIKFMKNNEVKGFFNIIKNIKSSLLKKTVVKQFVYILFLICVVMSEKILIPNTGNYFSKFITAMICIVELRSIAENMDFITGQTIFSKFTKIFTTKINNLLEKKEDK